MVYETSQQNDSKNCDPYHSCNSSAYRKDDVGKFNPLLYARKQVVYSYWILAVILYISWAFKDFFKNHKQNLRRTWYFFFIVGVVLLLNDTGFNVKEWQRYTLLAGCSSLLI